MSDRKILNDNMSDENFRIFLRDVFKQGARVLKPGGAFYVYHASKEVLNFVGAIVENGLLYKQMLVWVKNSMTLGRQDYQWRHEPCQPAGTQVRTPNGWVAIEDLKDGDNVVSFDTYSGTLKGLRDGLKIKTASRYYEGEMYEIEADGKKTRATDNHQFSIRFNPKPENKYCTYLMQKGNRYRVGRSVSYDARQFGLKTRMHQEKGDRTWIIDTFKTQLEAQMGEQLLSVKYGIPYTHWETEKPYCKTNENARTAELIDWLYEKLDPEQQEKNARKLLTDFGRNHEYPLIDSQTIKSKFSRRVTVKIHACNLITGLMQVPVSLDGYIKDSTFEWKNIDAVTFSKFAGTVYSLAVKTWQHYISDGIITHNCLYGWKDGASHYFVNNRSLTTVIEDQIDVEKMTKAEMRDLLKEMLSDTETPQTVIREDKPLRNGEHPTMKPVKLIGRNVYNSTRIYETVLDLFMGSGSTLIAAHQLKRNCYGAELDPKYCQVILDRFRKLEPECEIRKIEDNDTKTTN